MPPVDLSNWRELVERMKADSLLRVGLVGSTALHDAYLSVREALHAALPTAMT